MIGKRFIIFVLLLPCIAALCSVSYWAGSKSDGQESVPVDTSVVAIENGGYDDINKNPIELSVEVVEITSHEGQCVEIDIAPTPNPPVSIVLDKIGVIGNCEHWLRGRHGEIYAMVAVTDGVSTSEIRIPGTGHYSMAAGDIVPVYMELFDTDNVGDTLRIGIVVWESDGGPIEQAVCTAFTRAVGVWAAAQTGLPLEPLFVNILRELASDLCGFEDDHVGSYEGVWDKSNRWGRGVYEGVGSDNLRLWLRVE